MSKKRLPRSRPCVITALEILGLDDPATPEGRARQALMSVDLRFGDSITPAPFESYLSIAGGRVLHVAPIQTGGVFPFWSVLNVALLQNDLLPFGLLVRGAITMGPAIGGDFIHGRGVAEAERLRDEVAGVPRVIVDPRLLHEIELSAELRFQERPASVEFDYLRSVLRVDADGLWYADYLPVFGQSGVELAQYVEILEEHRRLVTRKLEASPALDKSSRALTWLWSYHNLVIEEQEATSTGESEALSQLRIPATGPLLFDFPRSILSPGASRGPVVASQGRGPVVASQGRGPGGSLPGRRTGSSSLARGPSKP